MKMAFYKPNELNELMTSLLDPEHSTYCKIGYSENLKTDAVFTYSNDNQDLISETALVESMPVISHHLNAVATSYDIIEVGDKGDGIAFFF